MHLSSHEHAQSHVAGRTWRAVHTDIADRSRRERVGRLPPERAFRLRNALEPGCVIGLLTFSLVYVSKRRVTRRRPSFRLPRWLP